MSEDNHYERFQSGLVGLRLLFLVAVYTIAVPGTIFVFGEEFCFTYMGSEMGGRNKKTRVW
jgi:hypothetical protein